MPITSQLSCPFCMNEFRRSEHLSRHILSHTGEKGHCCPICKKAFTRRDSLVRHIPIHEANKASHRAAQPARTARACIPCAQVRLKCDGLFPCGRCRGKSQNCTYPQRSRNRVAPIDELAKISGIPSPTTTIIQSDESSTPQGLPDPPTTITSSVGSPNSTDSALLHSRPPESPFNSEREYMDIDGVYSSNMSMTESENPSLSVKDHDLTSNAIRSPATMMDTETSTLVDPYSDIQFSQFSAISSEQNLLWDDDYNVLDVVFDTNFSPRFTSTDLEHLGHDQGAEQSQTSHEDLSSTMKGPEAQAQSSSDSPWVAQWSPTENDSIVSFPDMTGVSLDIIEAESYGHVEGISDAVYQCIRQALVNLGSTTNNYPSIRHPNLPSLAVFNCFIQLYFEHYHPNYPLLHMPTFNPSTAPWQISLAVAAVGSQYSKMPLANFCSRALLELLLRILLDTTAMNNTNVRNTWFIQCVLLKNSGMSSVGDRRLFEMAETSRNAGHTLCRKANAFRRPATAINPLNLDQTSRASSWGRWVQEEGLRRAGFCSFVMDVQTCIYHNSFPCILVEELQQWLPCREALWEAPTAKRWAELCSQGNAREMYLPTTIDVCHRTLSSGSLITPNVGTFAKLVAGLSAYARSVSLLRSLRTPLAPADFYPEAPEAIRHTGLSVLQNIRAKHALSEHPSVDIHIVLASMLLCVPWSTMMLYARYFGDKTARQEHDKQLRRWMDQEGGKTARQAVWYAGSLLGLLRNRTAHVPYESICLIICIMPIWIYSHLIATDPCGCTRAVNYSSERRSVIRLDRHPDDELIDAWITNESNIYAYLKDVGDISSSGAPSRILGVGTSHLMSLGACGFIPDLIPWLKQLQSLLSTRE